MKQKLIYVLMSFLFIASCSVDRERQIIPIEGIDGKTTLVVVSTEPEGESCPAGGTRLDFGIDLNEDGELSEDEITSTAFVCNGLAGEDGEDGTDGTSALVEVTAVTPGEDCPNGGVLVTNGYDLDGDGVLSENEIAGTTLVCNGTNGENGTNGFNSLIRTERIVESEVCTLGGFLIESGLDLNRNGILDDSEVNDSQTAYVCDGEDGKSLAIRVEYLDEENQYCGNGGYLVTIGLDQNGDGELDETEAESGTSFPVCNGEDGEDGVCEECEVQCEDGIVCIKHKLIGHEKPEDFDNVTKIIEDKNGRPCYVILTLTLSEFVYHTYESHSGSSTQGNHDSWYDCDKLND